MKQILLLVMLAACAGANADETFIRIKFVDSSGSAWATDKVNARLAAHLPPGRSAYTLVIAASSCSSEQYKAQNKELDALDHAIEEMGLLVVIGCPDYRDGYALNTPERDYVLSGHKQFRVLLLRGDGLLLKESLVPFSAPQIAEALNRAP